MHDKLTAQIVAHFQMFAQVDKVIVRHTRYIVGNYIVRQISEIAGLKVLMFSKRRNYIVQVVQDLVPFISISSHKRL